MLKKSSLKEDNLWKESLLKDRDKLSLEKCGMTSKDILLGDQVEERIFGQLPSMKSKVQGDYLK